MAKMIFAVSEKEFKVIVNRLYRQLPGMSQEPVGAIVDFLQGFMIDMENEIKIGHYDYELRVGNRRSVPLDDPNSEQELSKMVVRTIAF